MTRLTALISKFIYALFILWVGVLAPLIYFDMFAAGHHIQPYRFALFGISTRIRSPSPEVLASHLGQRLKQRFTHQPDLLVASSPFSGLAHLLQASLGQLYLSAGVTGLLVLLFRRLSLLGQVAGASIDLPPPEKPPRLIWSLI